MIIYLEKKNVSLFIISKPLEYIKGEEITFEEAIVLMFEECGISKEQIICDFSKDKSQCSFYASFNPRATTWLKFIENCTEYLDTFIVGGPNTYVYVVNSGSRKPYGSKDPEVYVNFMMQYFACAK